ncbi:MAG: 2-amino-4-hydroxy-6-hydroxymethyldihydropteridine diphosphokinase [Planctomycetaceae bacterium]
MSETQCLIAIGGNVQASKTLPKRAVQLLESSDLQVLRLSESFITAPVGENAGTEFVNAAAVIQTSLTPFELLGRLHATENQFGRTRDIHWGPRPLDLDLIFYGDQVIERPDLVIPHPAMWYRRFVLDPSIQVAADWAHPVLGVSVQDLHDRLLSRPLIFEYCLHQESQQTDVAQLSVPMENTIQHFLTVGKAELHFQHTEPRQPMSDVACARLIFGRPVAAGWSQPPPGQRFAIGLPLNSAVESIEEFWSKEMTNLFAAIHG